MSIRTTMVGMLLLLPGCSGASPVTDNTVTTAPVTPSTEAATLPVATPSARQTDAPAIPAVAPAGDAALPADVVAFRAKRDECDHFRGEEPSDPERAAFLEQALQRTCTGSDAALQALRKRHADRPAVIAALASYEDGIE